MIEEWIKKVKGERKHALVPSVFSMVMYNEEVREKRLKRHVSSQMWFVVLVTSAVVLSTLLIGLELDSQTAGTQGATMIYNALDLLFLLAFFVELIIRTSCNGWVFFANSWNLLDYSIVVLHCADWTASMQESGSSLRIGATFRVLRLLRISQHVEGVRAFHGMWLVLQGLVSSGKTLIYTGIFLAIMVYSFGVVIAELLGQEWIAQDRLAEHGTYFGSVFCCMLSVIQVWTLDSWCATIARPLSEIGEYLALTFFIICIIVCNWGVCNMIIALMTERLKIMNRDRAQKTGKFLQKIEKDLLLSLQDDFKLVDVDGSGQLDYEEFKALLRTKSVAQKLQSLGILHAEADELFGLMDSDNSNSISPEEFINGLQRFRGIARSSDLMNFLATVQRQNIRASENVQITRRLIEQADDLTDRLSVIGRAITAELRERSHANKRAEDVVERAGRRDGVIHAMEQERQTFFPSLKDPESSDEDDLVMLR